MSRTLYFLGFEEATEGQPVVSEDIRRHYGFDPDPKALAAVAAEIFHSEIPDDLESGMNLGFAAVDILDGSRKPEYIVPGVVRPMLFARNQNTVWQGFRKAYTMAGKARKQMSMLELPGFEEMQATEASGLLLGSLALSDGIRIVRAFSNSHIETAVTAAHSCLDRDAAVAVVFDRVVLDNSTISPTWTA